MMVSQAKDFPAVSEARTQSLSHGAQLELELDDVRGVRRVVPWDGRSPRVLTRSHELFSLGALPRGGLSR